MKNLRRLQKQAEHNAPFLAISSWQLPAATCLQTAVLSLCPCDRGWPSRLVVSTKEMIAMQRLHLNFCHCLANKNALKTTNQWMNKMRTKWNCWATVGTMSPTGTYVWNDQPARGYCFTITGSRLQLISTVHPWQRACWPGTKIKQVAIAFISSRTTKQ